MAIDPKKFREIVFQLLYSTDFGESRKEDLFDFMMEQFSVTKKVMYLAEEQALSILSKLSEIDLLIAKASHSYDFDRISRVEKNILRLSTYELLYKKELPPKVVIAEALRLSQKFASPEGVSFVHAILDAILGAGCAQV